ncbi:DUF4190 domain-containing protein [Kitasatospora sp. NPDC049285]|uniref:DUF4190 domain-containing protein n=1 Tax=Kitasatospora sp. NPDC049285 TaxID=3157096 RepID=UPI003435B123
MSNPYQTPDPYGGAGGYGQPQQQPPGYGYPQQQPPVQDYGYQTQPYPAPQPGYGYPQQPVPAAPQQNTLATAAAAIGLISVLTSCFYGGLLGLVGIGVGIAALNKATQTGQGRGVAIGGIVISTLGVLISIALLVFIFVVQNK